VAYWVVMTPDGPDQNAPGTWRGAALRRILGSVVLRGIMRSYIGPLPRPTRPSKGGTSLGHDMFLCLQTLLCFNLGSHVGSIRRDNEQLTIAFLLISSCKQAVALLSAFEFRKA
jgi:hypothetical protein